MLNEVFSAFDELAEQHGLEKIKTIGDAYMVVAGIPEPRADHAIAIARAWRSTCSRRVAASRDAHGRDLAIRIGIHTGPVVAGVIGEKKFIYDLWGDTVNTASRMESHGVPGAIQVTERRLRAAARALRADRARRDRRQGHRADTHLASRRAHRPGIGRRLGRARFAAHDTGSVATTTTPTTSMMLARPSTITRSGCHSTRSDIPAKNSTAAKKTVDRT